MSTSGEVTLETSVRLTLADLRFGDSGAPPAALAWLASLAGTQVSITETGPQDRWERRAARIAVAGPGPVDVAEVLVGEGWAAVDAGERDRLCSPDLLQVEAGARRRGIGLWAAGGTLLPADDLAALSGALGRFVVVEGRVVSVGERRGWTYLNFSRDWSRALSVSVPKRTWTSLQARGITAATLSRKRVRVRGTVEMRRGPTLELVVPDHLERLDE